MLASVHAMSTAFILHQDEEGRGLGREAAGQDPQQLLQRSTVSTRMRSIRDADAEGSVGTIMPDEALLRRNSAQSGTAGPGSVRRGASSLRHVESISQMPSFVQEPPLIEDQPLSLAPTEPEMMDPSDGNETLYNARTDRNDDTPTNEHPMNLNTTLDYSPVDRLSYDTHDALTYSHERDRDPTMPLR